MKKVTPQKTRANTKKSNQKGAERKPFTRKLDNKHAPELVETEFLARGRARDDAIS